MFKQELEKLQRQGLLRRMREVRSAQGPRIMLEGREVINLCSNNYLGLADDPRLKEAARAALEEYGAGSGASRLISGTTTLHSRLEERIARFKGTEAALVFNSGYAANLGIISSLLGRGDIIFSDRLNHASIVDGCLLSGAEFVRYPHCDIAALEKMLEEHKSTRAQEHTSGALVHWCTGAPKRKRLIVTDTVFSMDGDIAPLPELVQAAKRYGCMLMIDEAHATGVLGEKGKGAVEYFGLEKEFSSRANNFIQMGTFSKALGSFGAYAAGSREFIDYLINKSRAFIYTTALPASVLAAGIAAMDIIENEPQLRQRLWDNIRFFDAKSPTQIIPFLIGDNDKAVRISNRLLDEGIFIQAIRPPTVPKGTSRLRASIMATHTRQDLAQALKKIKEAIR
jgi:glycine C-acetyltransferase